MKSDLDFVLGVYLDSLVKAAKVNIVTGEFQFVKEMESERKAGVLDITTMDDYPKMIVKNGWIHPDDEQDYLYHMRLSYLREKLREKDTRRVVHSFRRVMGEGYAWITVCVALPADFTEDDPWVSYTWRIADNDSRAMEDALCMLSGIFHKILKVNLTTDTYEAIKVYKEEVKTELGYSASIAEWLYQFAMTGNVHSDDLQDYLSFTSVKKLRAYFRENREQIRLRYRRRLGSGFRWVVMTLLPSVEYTDDNQIIMLYIRDIHDEYVEEQEHRRQLEYYCNYDSLTGLKNRYYYANACERFEKRSSRPATAAMFADINGLKYINDNYGHEAGDDHIRRFGKMLLDDFGADLACRVSGDEFVVVLEDVTEAEAAARYADFHAKLSKDPLPLAAIGFAWSETPRSISELVSAAEAVMYEDKKDCYFRSPENARYFEGRYKPNLE